MSSVVANAESGTSSSSDDEFISVTTANYRASKNEINRVLKHLAKETDETLPQKQLQQVARKKTTISWPPKKLPSERTKSLQRVITKNEEAIPTSSNCVTFYDSSIVSNVQKDDLERKLEAALKAGNVAKASECSDQISQVEHSIQLRKRKAATDYLKEKEENEKKSRKKKKLEWTFETKKRWETKSNM